MYADILDSIGYKISKYKINTEETDLELTFHGKDGYHTLTANSRERLKQAIKEFAAVNRVRISYNQKLDT